MDAASRLPWRVGLVCALVSGAAFHALAASLQAPKIAPSADVTSVVAHNLYGTIAALLQFVVPAGFLVGALVAFIRRSRGAALFVEAQSEPHRAFHNMTWTQFERLVGEIFRRRGYGIRDAGGGGSDGGIDVVLSKGSDRFFVQCKQWRSQRVGVTVIRELYGVVVARKAAGGFVVTCGDFTSEARKFAQDCGVELINGQALISLMRDIDRAVVDDLAISAAPALLAGNASLPNNNCPKCGSAMVRRTARRGQRSGQDFLGCTRYPDCRGTRQVAASSGGAGE